MSILREVVTEAAVCFYVHSGVEFHYTVVALSLLNLLHSSLWLAQAPHRVFVGGGLRAGEQSDQGPE